MVRKARKYTTKSAKETQKLGKMLASELSSGRIIGLMGDLGGGKTTFTQGVASGLGIKKNVISPTFVFWRRYNVPKKKKLKYLCHLDLYRLQNPEEIYSLGIDEYWRRNDTVCLIEWAEKIKRYLPEKKIYFVKFKIIDPKTREITMN